MQIKILIVLLVLVVVAVPASAQRVKVTSDPSVDLARYKTYAWAQPVPRANPGILLALLDAIDQEMAAKGVKLVESDPQLTVTFWTSTESDLHVAYKSTSSPSSPPALSHGISSGSSWPITKGTLVVVLVDPVTKNTVWRGQANHTLEYGPSGDLAKDAKTVDKPIRKAVSKMFKQFPRPK